MVSWSRLVHTADCNSLTTMSSTANYQQVTHRDSVAMNDVLIGILQQRIVQASQHGWQAGLLVQSELELPIDVGLNGSPCKADHPSGTPQAIPLGTQDNGDSDLHMVRHNMQVYTTSSMHSVRVYSLLDCFKTKQWWPTCS